MGMTESQVNALSRKQIERGTSVLLMRNVIPLDDYHCELESYVTLSANEETVDGVTGTRLKVAMACTIDQFVPHGEDGRNPDDLRRRTVKMVGQMFQAIRDQDLAQSKHLKGLMANPENYGVYKLAAQGQEADEELASSRLEYFRKSGSLRTRVREEPVAPTGPVYQCVVCSEYPEEDAVTACPGPCRNYACKTCAEGTFQLIKFQGGPRNVAKEEKVCQVCVSALRGGECAPPPPPLDVREEGQSVSDSEDWVRRQQKTTEQEASAR